MCTWTVQTQIMCSYQHMFSDEKSSGKEIQCYLELIKSLDLGEHEFLVLITLLSNKG